jgi:hypothetical protein
MAAHLMALEAELRKLGQAAILDAGRPLPRLHLSSPAAGRAGEQILAWPLRGGSWWYVRPGTDRIGPARQPALAAAVVAHAMTAGWPDARKPASEPRGPAGAPLTGVSGSLELLRARAIRALREHVSEHGQCVACGGAGWPCERALLAALNLDLVDGAVPLPEQQPHTTPDPGSGAS